MNRLSHLGKKAASFAGVENRTLARVFAVGLSSVLALAMVGSVLALSFETAQLSGYIQSNQYDPATPPTGDINLRIKQGPCLPGDDPAGTDFTDGTALTLTAPPEFDLASVALQAEGEAYAPLGDICIANIGPSIGQLDLAIISSSSSEVGPCGGVESSGEQNLGHLGCVDGDEGELHLYTNFQAVGTGGPNCGYLWTNLGATTGPQLVGTMASGEVCGYSLALHSEFFQNTTAVPDDRLAAALTDTLLFDLELTLSVV